ncbi:helix-turn-helix domain-containing protein [Colwelliaceae bacterium BS250]
MNDLLKKPIHSFSGTHIPVHEYDAVFSAFELENIPLTKDATINSQWLSSTDYTLISRSSDCYISQHGKSTDNAFSLYLPSSSKESQQDFITQPVSQEQCFIIPPNGSGRWGFTAGNTAQLMAIDITAMKRVMSNDEVEQLTQGARNIRRSMINPNKLQSISTQLCQLINEQDVSSLTEFELAQKLDFITMSIFLSIDSKESTKLITHKRSSSCVFKKAIEYIKGNYYKQITIGDIANDANTTTRTLQYKFNQQMALSPLQFLRLYRLYKFHQTLVNSKTVESAAYACGFTHMGRVALSYKDIYGMSPSTYLKSKQSSNFYRWLSHHPSKSYVA